ncbi:hypothetical protein [Streptomyces angustmyceticus]|uniref:hypothetical protein n=1 Tax=Streptomyces angustmyceticus TaxID=285578 RepID=UPI0021AE3FDE|nr:hypothetical protein [Streptomyces angustmyceticus]
MSWNKASEVDADVRSAAASAATAGSAARRGRRIAAASLIAVAAFSLTACGSDGDDAKASTKVSSRPDASDVSKEADALGDVADEPSTKGTPAPSRTASEKSGGGNAKTGHGTTDRHSGKSGGGKGGGSTSGGGASAGATAGSGSTPDTDDVSGTWNGVLKYLAPGKMTVAPDSGAEQGFDIGPDTKVLGAAALCGDPDGNVTMDDNGYGTTPCTESQLDEAARTNAVSIRVTVVDGVATEVAEHYHP